MTDDRPGAPGQPDEASGYAVPPQVASPPDADRWSSGAGSVPPPPPGPPPFGGGPPQVPPEDVAGALWGPAPAPAEPHRWGMAAGGGTALLDRTAPRRPVVAPPVRPLPPPPPAQAWDWEASHGLRNALLAAVGLLLTGSLIAAFVVLRSKDDDKRSAVVPPGVVQPVDPSEPPVDPAAGGVTATVPSVAPVSVPPVTPPATTAPAVTTPATAAPRTTTAPAPTTPTTQRSVTPTVTASPPYTGGPIPSTTSTLPRTTTSSTRPATG